MQESNEWFDTVVGRTFFFSVLGVALEGNFVVMVIKNYWESTDYRQSLDEDDIKYWKMKHSITANGSRKEFLVGHFRINLTSIFCWVWKHFSSNWYRIYCSDVIVMEVDRIYDICLHVSLLDWWVGCKLGKFLEFS